MIMNRIRIIGIFILMLAVIAPEAALADWKIYYTGAIGKYAGYGGRGSFATRPQCESYRMTQPSGDQRMSYCSGFDTPSYTPDRQSPHNGGDSTAEREQKKGQQQLQAEQKERELEFARQKKFAEEKDKLVGAFKGTGTGTLGLKGTGIGAPELKTPYSKGARDSAPVDQAVLQEEDEFNKNNPAWIENQKKLFQQRLEKSNKWCGALYNSLKTKAPPLPYKKFDELQPGDVLLIDGGEAIPAADNLLSGDKVSHASHTVLYLKEVNGKKLFMDNQPGEGPRIISEDVFLKRYGSREADVAKLAQPLNKKEAKDLFTAAVEMARKNRKTITDNLLGTNYGVWGRDNVVCSEADWALLKVAGRAIPQSGDKEKVAVGIYFSPADYINNEYFLVTPLAMPK